MLPMRMMNAVVAFQMDNRRAPLPTNEQMIRETEELIAEQEARLARIESAVTEVLKQRSVELIAALEDIYATLLKDDPNGAVRPLLEGVMRDVADIVKIEKEAVITVEKSNEQLRNETQQYNSLQHLLKKLQYTLKNGDDSQVRGLLKECAGKAASYAAKH